MMDYLTIGSVPTAEDCAQVGSEGFYEKSQKECRAFKHQLERMFPEPPLGAYFKVKGFPHDFGTYYEVCVIYNSNDEEAENFAYKVENNSPEYWDEEARKELGLVPTEPVAAKVHAANLELDRFDSAG